MVLLRTAPASASSAAAGPTAAPRHLECAHPAYGVHDTFRHGIRYAAGELVAPHPLEHALAHAEAVQLENRIALDSRVFGAHAGMRLQLENTLLNLRPPSAHVMAGIARCPSYPSAEMLLGREENFHRIDLLGRSQPGSEVFTLRDQLESHFDAARL